MQIQLFNNKYYSSSVLPIRPPRHLALFGLLFADNQEAAFANYRMFQATGFALAFGYSQFLCVRTKVFIMAGLLLVALVFYSAVEFKMQQNKKLRQGIVIL